MALRVKRDQDGTIGTLGLLFWRLNWRLVSQKKYRLLPFVHSQRKFITEPFFHFEAWVDALFPVERRIWKGSPGWLNKWLTDSRRNSRHNLHLKGLFQGVVLK